MAPDKPLKDLQDNIVDTFGPLCTMFENLLVMLDSLGNEGVVQLDKSSVNFFLSSLSCVKHALLLAGDASASINVNCRELVLKKILPLLASMAQEHFPDAKRQLFGPGFEQTLKSRSETADTIEKAAKVSTPSRGNRFFVEWPSEGDRQLVEAANLPLRHHSNHFLPGVEDFVDGHPNGKAHVPGFSTHSNTSSTTNSEWSPTPSPCRYVFKLFSNSADHKYSSDRSSKIPSASLAKDYSRPMGLTGNPGLSVGALINPNTTSSAHIPQIDSSRTEVYGSGSPGIIRQAGCPSDLSQRYCRFHKFFVCGAQEGWRKPPSCKFETSQPISGVQTLQNGRYSHVERPSKTGRLSGQDRSQGCIFDHSNLERSSNVFTFSMERNIARVCLPSVWASHSTQGFHQTYETCHSHVETGECA